jgi:hypothetical protein
MAARSQRQRCSGRWRLAACSADADTGPRRRSPGPGGAVGAKEFLMTRFNRALCALVAVAAMAASVSTVLAQAQPKTSIVSIYRIAPGKHLAFLKWMAARDAADREAGVPATQWYRHLDGDSWDYVAIAPNHYGDTAAMGDKVDSVARKHGLTTGMKASLELRELMASHTDTIAEGPSTAAELVQEASQP